MQQKCELKWLYYSRVLIWADKFEHVAANCIVWQAVVDIQFTLHSPPFVHPGRATSIGMIIINIARLSCLETRCVRRQAAIKAAIGSVNKFDKV